MGVKSAGEIQGFEYDWLASDEGGCVALFSTAGAGYAPREFLLDTDAHDAAIDAVLALPPSTQASFAPDLGPDATNTWKLMAERGIYAYDCDPTRQVRTVWWRRRSLQSRLDRCRSLSLKR